MDTSTSILLRYTLVIPISYRYFLSLLFSFFFYRYFSIVFRYFSIAPQVTSIGRVPPTVCQRHWDATPSRCPPGGPPEAPCCSHRFRLLFTLLFTPFLTLLSPSHFAVLTFPRCPQSSTIISILELNPTVPVLVIPSPYETATATCRRCERRPTDVSEVSCIFMWKGYISVRTVYFASRKRFLSSAETCRDSRIFRIVIVRIWSEKVPSASVRSIRSGHRTNAIDSAHANAIRT